MIVAVIPISGRPDILRITIPKLTKQIDKIILMGQITGRKDDDYKFWSEYFSEADFYYCTDKTLGYKWQYCVDASREYNPDILLISSSGGVFRDDYFDLKSDLTGSGALYYLDYQPSERRMIYWPGYNSARSTEPVGLGRMFGREFLDKCKWKLFDTKANRGLDSVTMKEILRFDPEITITKDNSPLRISSYKYVQLNSFDRMARQGNSVKIIAGDMDGILKSYGL